MLYTGAIHPSKQQEGKQNGSSGADYICRLSGTVQDRGAVPSVFVSAAVSAGACVSLLRRKGVLSHLPPEPVPVQEVPQTNFCDCQNCAAPHAPFSGAVILGDLPLRQRQAGHFCVSAGQNAGKRL